MSNIMRFGGISNVSRKRSPWFCKWFPMDSFEKDRTCAEHLWSAHTGQIDKRKIDKV